MLLFIVLSCLLLALLLAVVIPPLWRKARGLALGLLAALPLVVALLYLWKGKPEAIEMPAGPVQAAPASGEGQPASMEQAIAGLEQRLASEPGNAQGWALLGRSRMVQGQFVQAREAYANASTLLPDDIDLKVDYAEAQMRAWPGEGFPPAAAGLLEQALATDPKHVRALYLLGLYRASSGEAAKALAHWQALLPLLDEAQALQLRKQLEELSRASGLPLAAETPATAPGAGVGSNADTIGAATLRVEISLDPTLAARIAAGDTLFVVARSADGAGPPAAVKRMPATGFPLQLELSDRDSMLPSLLLSGQASVRVSARISRSGSATPASGDIEADAVAAKPGDAGVVRLRLSRARP